MLPQLKERFDRMERQRTALLAELSALPAERITCRPDAGCWSAVDVIEHLVIAEEGVLARMERPIRPIALTARMKTALLYRVVMIVMRTRLKVKAPLPALLPAGGADLADLSRRWGEARCRMAGVLDAVTADKARARVVKHPIAGFLTFSQGLDFLMAHIEHHRGQIGRAVGR